MTKEQMVVGNFSGGRELFSERAAFEITAQGGTFAPYATAFYLREI